MGLLLPHIFTVSVYNDMVTLSQQNPTEHKGGGKRNEIRNFSKESRYRLFRLFHSLQFERFTFITLTYAKEFPLDPRESKRHLQAFRRAFERRYGAVRAVWRCERQHRGAIHYHILYLDPPYVPVQDLETIWHKARAGYGKETSRNSVDLKVSHHVAGADVVSKYLGKYISKVDEDCLQSGAGSIGRVWGKWNIEDPEPIKIELERIAAWKLAKLILSMRAEEKWQPGNLSSFTCFGSSMGSTSYRNIILGMIAQVASSENPIYHRNITFDTSNIAV